MPDSEREQTDSIQRITKTLCLPWPLSLGARALDNRRGQERPPPGSHQSPRRLSASS